MPPTPVPQTDANENSRPSWQQGALLTHRMAMPSPRAHEFFFEQHYGCVPGESHVTQWHFLFPCSFLCRAVPGDASPTQTGGDSCDRRQTAMLSAFRMCQLEVEARRGLAEGTPALLGSASVPLGQLCDRHGALLQDASVILKLPFRLQAVRCCLWGQG